MKRVLKVLTAVALVAIALGSCAPAAPKELIINSYMSDEQPKAVFQDLVEAFKKANPDLAVTVNTIAHEQFKTQLPS